MLLALIAGATTAGFLAGMFGIGGGAVVIPMLIHVYKSEGLPATEAIRLAFGTSLATMAFTGLSSFLSHKRRGNVDFAWVKRLFFPAGLGAVMGALLASRIPGAWLAFGLSCMLGYFGVKLLLKQNDSMAVSPVLERLSQAAGLLSGVAYSLAGMGGASVITFYLTSVGLPLKKAIGTATGVILPISLGAILGFGVTAGAPHDWRWGYIDLHALPVLSICAVIASRLGVRAAAAIAVARLRFIFGMFMLALSVRTLIDIFR
jgi:uncharacterized membrane protein YfcA